MGMEEGTSTSGAAIFLGLNLISWWSRKQQVVAHITMWLQTLLEQLGVPTLKPLILCDSQIVAAQAHKPIVEREKSTISRSISSLCIREAADFLNSSVLSMPFLYLGIPIGTNPRHSAIWDPVVRKIPDKVVDKLINIQRRFLWGGGLEQQKIAWVNWKIVCLPKDKGGLGIKDLQVLNTALLGKWSWELFQNHGDMWTRILTSKYGGWRSLADARSSSHLSPWWKDLLQITHQ
ncbi:uncharacterized protein [Glycine max]|uniref:uncharacterized protein n=1 Tax=Glycine max TaxID=3847 RepID=UPI001B355959|nr:uncharacterized protein LOC121173951 [Glycine max]